MSTTSVVVSVRQALVAALVARVELSGVQITYAYPGETVQAESIWTQNGEIGLDFAALKAGRKTRNEETNFELVISVQIDGGTQEDADLRALLLGQSVENLLADDPAVFKALGAYETKISRARLVGGYLPQGRVGEVVYTIGYKARLN